MTNIDHLFDFSDAEINDIKIIFTGTVGSGKSQAISTISTIDVVQTDVLATDDVYDMKDTTTVAMDYGELALDDETTLALYGTPGQERFRFMWEILTRGALGVVIMVDNSRDDPLLDMETYLENFRECIANSTAVIGVTHTDVSPEPSMEKYYDYMQAKGYLYPVYPIDARKTEDVNLILESLAAMIVADSY